MDCYGLIIMYLREVSGIDLGSVPQTDIAAGFAQARGWAECGPIPGSTCFMTWRNGAPTHCGVLLPGGRLLHSQEGAPPAAPETGSVRITRLAVMTRACPDLRFYRYLPC
jgi:cell wall-associated NlpC family hydrolase